MATNKNNPQTGSKGSMASDQDREFQGQGKNKDFDRGGQGQSAGGTQQGSRSHDNMEDDEMKTAGGRSGQFSESDRGDKGQWSPGSTQSSDQ